MLNKNLLKSKQIPLEFQSDPKKFKKYHKIKYVNACPDTSLKVGGLSLLINKHLTLTPKQLLVILKLLKPGLKRSARAARINLPIKVDTILTKKPKDIRMGRGKGAPSEKVFLLKAGKSLFTLYGLSALKAIRLCQICAPKLHTSKKINRQEW